MSGTTMQQRRGTASQWSTGNPILKAGEFGVTTDTGVMKVGDGVNNWNALPVFQDSLLFRTATDLATSNALVKRDANGGAHFGKLYSSQQPVGADELTRKDYVDASDAAGVNVARRRPYRVVTTDTVLALTDEATVVNVSATTDISLTIPANAGASFPIGSWVDVIRGGTGQVNIVPAANVRLIGPDNKNLFGAGSLPIRSTFGSVRLYKYATDSWIIYGDILLPDLAAATASTLPFTLVKRDANGRFQAVDPSVAADVATKAYSDALGVSAPTVSTIVRRDSAGRFQAASPSAVADVVTKAYADALGVSAPTISTIVRRDAAGRFQAADPSASADVSTKNYVDNIPICRVRRSAAVQTISTNTFTVVAFDTKDLDTTGSMWAAGSAGYIVVPKAGIYRVTCSVGFGGSWGASARMLSKVQRTTGGTAFDVYVGQLVLHEGASEVTATATGLIALLANDQVSMQVYQDSGASQNTTGAAYAPTSLEVEYVRP